MKHVQTIDKQDYLTFSGTDLIIVDKIQNMPENSTFYSEYVLIMICTAGKIQINYDGQPFTIQQDELFLSVPGSTLSDYMQSPHFDCKILLVRPSEALTYKNMQNQKVNSLLYIKTHPVTRLSENDKSIVFDYYNLICNRIQDEKHHFFNSEIRALLNAFLLRIVGIMDRNMDLSETNITVHGEQIIEKFLRMVSEDGGRNRLVEYYADKLYITAKYLSTLVRTSIGRTPSEVIQAATMKEIERRLRYSDESLKEISHSLNFPNTSFFGKYFKQRSGMTPNNFRKKYSK
ncbi:MAG: helix-turn-helix domain-containing protein [Prevotella sp.]|nr:helix-turn-helix domain-containing protein [Prevotella sp.]